MSRTANRFAWAWLVAFCLLPGLTTTTVLATDNQPPVIDAASPSVTVGESLQASMFGTASDPDGDHLSYSASSGTVGTSSIDGYQWEWHEFAGNGPSDKQITVTATDSNGAHTDVQFSMHVDNRPPALTITGPQFVPPNGATRYYESTADDIDSFTKEFKCGSGGPVAQGPGGINGHFWFTCAFNQAGTRQVGVEATDSDGDSSSALLDVTATTAVNSQLDAPLTVVGDELNRPLGGSLAMADLNGDGRDELIVGRGDSGYDPQDGLARHVWVVRGGSTTGTIHTSTLGTNGFAITGPAGERGFGMHIAALGDINGDGFDDIAIASEPLDSGNFKGVYVLYGRTNFGAINVSSLTFSQGFRIDAPAVGGHVAVAGGGDYNGDGLDDVLVGAPSQGGSAFIVFGKTSRSADVDLAADPTTFGIKFTGTLGGPTIGDNLALADVTGDGYADAVFGAGGSPVSVRVVYGGHAPQRVVDVTTATATGSQKGYAYQIPAISLTGVVLAVGKVNNDSYRDIVIGYDPTNPPAGQSHSIAQVLFGRAGAPTQTASVVAKAGGVMAVAVQKKSAIAGSVVLGIPFAVENGERSGSAYVVNGLAPGASVDLDSLGSWARTDGSDLDYQTGAALATGDFNGDGGIDLAIGADAATTDTTTGVVGLFKGHAQAADTTPPQAYAPATEFASGLIATSKAAPIVVSWPAGSDDTGVVRYVLQVRTNAAPWTKVTLPSDGSKSVQVMLKEGATSQFRVRAIDAADNKSPWATGHSFTLRVVEENNSSVKYTGSFARVARTGSLGGYVDRGPTATGTATLTFTGSAVAFVTTTGPTRGNISISVDSAAASSVSLNTGSVKPAWDGYAWVGTSGPHKIVVTATDGHAFEVDAFLVLN